MRSPSMSRQAILASGTPTALEMNGIDQLGLTPLDRKYLDTIIRVFGGGPAGIEAIAHTMNTVVDTLSDVVNATRFRNIGPFRTSAWITEIAVPESPPRDHLYTIYAATRTGGRGHRQIRGSPRCSYRAHLSWASWGRCCGYGLTCSLPASTRVVLSAPASALGS
jgi:hypothetical protein